MSFFFTPTAPKGLAGLQALETQAQSCSNPEEIAKLIGKAEESAKAISPLNQEKAVSIISGMYGIRDNALQAREYKRLSSQGPKKAPPSLDSLAKQAATCTSLEEMDSLIKQAESIQKNAKGQDLMKAIGIVGKMCEKKRQLNEQIKALARYSAKGASNNSSSGPRSRSATAPIRGAQALGISNPRNNCWAIGMLHLLHQIPQFRREAQLRINVIGNERKNLLAMTQKYDIAERVDDLTSEEWGCIGRVGGDLERSLRALQQAGKNGGPRSGFIENRIAQEIRGAINQVDGLTELVQLLGQYDQGVGPSSQAVRLAVRKLAPQISPDMRITHDPLTALEPLLSFLGMEYDLNSTISDNNGIGLTSKSIRKEAFIDCNIRNGSSISEQLKASLRRDITSGFGQRDVHIPATQVKKLTHATNDLLIKANRFSQADGVQRKITTPIEVNLQLTLGDAELQNGPEAAYQLETCILHHGAGINAGHYTTLLRTSDGGWEWANDSVVCRWDGRKWINVQSNAKSPYTQAPEEMMNENCYVLHYRKVGDPEEQKHRPVGRDGQQPAGHPLRSASGHTNSTGELIAPHKTAPPCHQRAAAIGLNIATYVLKQTSEMGAYLWKATLGGKQKQG